MTDSVPIDSGDRLERQLAYVRELDRLKSVLRRTSLIDRSRLENTAEHSWHLATMAVVLAGWPRVVQTPPVQWNRDEHQDCKEEEVAAAPPPPAL